MLQVDRAFPQRSAEQQASESSLKEIFSFLRGIVRRHRAIFVVVTAFCFACGALYLVTARSSYTATADMVLDLKKVQLFASPEGNARDEVVDAGTVQTQVEMIKSQNVGLAVIRDLHLDEDPEFVSPKPGFIGSVFNLLTGAFLTHQPSSEGDLQRRALGVFMGNETVARLGQTYVMEVSYRSHDPAKAARIANAIVDAYVNDQLDSKYQATRRASRWLQDRIRELRAQTISADQAVVNFKKTNNIVDTGGKLMNEQQLSEVNSQLVLAQAATAQAKAKLDRIKNVLKEPIPDASVADALANPVIIALRTKYLDLAGREAIWTAKYGANHQATQSLRTQMTELRHNISDEMQKIAQGYQSDYEIALARENSIKNSLSQSVSETQSTSQASIQLRNLESTSASYKSMYDVLLQRYMQAVQQQSFPISEARLIGPASPPASPSNPKKSVVFAGTIAAALFLSFGLALTREYLDQVFRSGQQVFHQLGTHCVATLPLVRRETLVYSSLQGADPQARATSTLNPMLRYALEMPFSQYTEALRSAKVSIDMGLSGTKGKILGVTSSLPGEGKSTVAANLAQMIAHAGNRVLLIDGDLRNSHLTNELTGKPSFGLVEASENIDALDQILWADPTSGLHFLPASASTKLAHTNQILGSEKVAKLIARLQEQYDYIIMDCAPLTPVVDTRTTAHLVDAYMYVVAWGRTKVDVIEHTLSEAPEIFDRVLGVVLNKADMTVLGRYEAHRSNAYLHKYYTRYITAS